MTSSQRPALGRGLSALIPTSNRGSGGVDTVDIDLIAPNPQQPRMHFDQASLQELAESIREHGVLQPIIVTRVTSDLGPDTYQLIAGERRLQAARIAGETRMPVIVKEAAGNELLELALVENIQRQDLNPIEEAMAFGRLSDEFGMTQEKIAARVGRSRTAVANIMRLLTLHDDIRASIASGQISEGHARALLSIEHPAIRLDAWRRIVSDELTVRQVEEIAKALKSTAAGAEPVRVAAHERQTPDPHLRAIEDDLRHAFGTKVSLTKSGNGGRITITFHSNEELEALLERFGV
jgi:ParB family chromosome partitioning protein